MIIQNCIKLPQGVKPIVDPAWNIVLGFMFSRTCDLCHEDSSCLEVVAPSSVCYLQWCWLCLSIYIYIYTYNNLHNQTHTLRQFEAVLEAVFEAGIPRCCEEGPIIFCVVWTWLNGMIGVYVICYMLPSTWDHIPLDRQYFDPKGALSTVGLLVTRLHVELLAKTSCRYCRLQMTPDWNKMCSKGDQYPIYIYTYIYIYIWTFCRGDLFICA